MNERLLHIKAKRDAGIVDNIKRFEYIDVIDFDWLIERAELFEETQADAMKLHEQNKRYKEALVEISESYCTTACDVVAKDALKGDNNDN